MPLTSYTNGYPHNIAIKSFSCIAKQCYDIVTGILVHINYVYSMMVVKLSNHALTIWSMF